jgi:hypothetical protein
MINKFYKRIHIKYSGVFKFIYFLRYLLGIFFISIVLILSIPKFFDYSKKEQIIKDYLLESYSLNLKNYEKIKFNSLPTPNLEIHNAYLDLSSSNIKFRTAKINIYPKLISIYNYKKFEARKIILNKNNIILDVNNFTVLIEYISKLKKKLTFRDLNLEINKEKESILNLKKINFSTYGYKKNIIEGKIFEKKFKISLKNNFKKINLKLLNSGIYVEVTFKEKKENIKLNGNIKAKILNSNLKFNFQYDDKRIKISNSFFRNKNLSFENESLIIHKPFFEINSNFFIKNINSNIFNNINLINLFKLKEKIKQINSKNSIRYKSKKFNSGLIKDLNLDVNLAYGRLSYSKNILIAGGSMKCNGDINLMEEYPVLNFACSINSESKKKFLKNFLVSYKKKNEQINLNFNGALNILNKKINFQSILGNGNYNASDEDLKYFKDTFENILFDEDYLNIFNLEKIKRFILEVS